MNTVEEIILLDDSITKIEKVLIDDNKPIKKSHDKTLLIIATLLIVVVLGLFIYQNYQNKKHS